MANKENTAKESVFGSIIKPIVVLLVICVVCGVLLAALNKQTKPLIEENERLATQKAFLAVLPEGTEAESLTTLEVSTDGIESAVVTPDGVVAVEAVSAGYSGKDVTVYVAFDADGVISGIQVDASTQTSGIGSKTGAESFYSGFLGWESTQQVTDGAPVDTISGATYSSSAVFEAVNNASLCYNNELKSAATP